MRGNNARFTIHAGEAFGLPSIHEAIAFCGADRLGHGVRIVDDITVGPDGERQGSAGSQRCCGTSGFRSKCARVSNVQTGAVDSIAEHPFDLLARLRFRVTVNTDNRLMSDTTMSQEMLRLVEAFGYGWSDLRALHHQRDEVGVHLVRRTAGDHRRRDQAALRGADRLIRSRRRDRSSYRAFMRRACGSPCARQRVGEFGWRAHESAVVAGELATGALPSSAGQRDGGPVVSSLPESDADADRRTRDGPAVRARRRRAGNVRTSAAGRCRRTGRPGGCSSA